ncbi:MAG: hypothetical protein ACQ9MH_18630 [Nitrospinales bacterium]
MKNKAAIYILKISRRLYATLFKFSGDTPRLTIDYCGQAASDLIKKRLLSDKPCMIARLGTNELNAILIHLDTLDDSGFFTKANKFIKNEIGPFWWDYKTIFLMEYFAGFFPANSSTLEKFAKTMLTDIQQIDILGSWQDSEVRLKGYFPNATIVQLQDLEPYYHTNPWSEALLGKKVLVIHPYKDSIQKQYAHRQLLYKDPRILPEFEMITLRSVQSIAGNQTVFSDWFEAFEWMCQRIRDIDFDVAIIGAGAYGLPLASFVKSIGKKAIHLGGATQILFGIRGSRWDRLPFFKQLYNDSWVRPLPEETPENYQDIESGCYW